MCPERRLLLIVSRTYAIVACWSHLPRGHEQCATRRDKRITSHNRTHPSHFPSLLSCHFVLRPYQRRYAQALAGQGLLAEADAFLAKVLPTVDPVRTGAEPRTQKQTGNIKSNSTI